MWPIQYLTLLSLFGPVTSRGIQRNINADLAINQPLLVTDASPGQVIKARTTLRILCVGDSITVGHSSERLDGYRADLKGRLSQNNEVVFAGTEHGGAMPDGYFAAWNGKTIRFLAENVGPSLKQRPNLILLHTGTNDMAPLERIATEGNDPAAAAERLGGLLDLMITACPDAVIIVAVIVSSCQTERIAGTREYQALIPEVVQARYIDGHKVLAADFSTIPDSFLNGDCIHPSTEGYQEMSRYWYDFITQVPKEWLQAPRGSDPARDKESGGMRSTSGSFGPRAWAVVGLAWLMHG